GPWSREAVMAPLLVKALADAPAGWRVGASASLDARAGDVVHVYGRRESIAAIRRELPASVRIVEHGPGFGVALVDAESTSIDEAAEWLSWDVVAFDQRGCLSPKVALVRGSQ